MDVTRKHIKIGAAKMFNTTLLFSRVIGLQASSRETIDIRNLLSYELAPVPTSMFTDSGDMRIGKSKEQLKTQLQVDCKPEKHLKKYNAGYLMVQLYFGSFIGH